jgi:hypothetical protein
MSAMHDIDALYQAHLARRQLPSRDLIEQHTSGITDENVSRAIADRLACALPSAEAIDYLRRHLRAPLLTVAAGIGFWAHCLHHVHGISAWLRFIPKLQVKRGSPDRECLTLFENAANRFATDDNKVFKEAARQLGADQGSDAFSD